MSLFAVQRLVLEALGAWERQHPTGSARPTFDREWRRACAMEQHAGTALEAEETWQQWLEGGRPLTRERERALLEAAGPGAARILQSLGIRTREPGEDDAA